MKRYTKEFITKQIKKYKQSRRAADVELVKELGKIYHCAEWQTITDFEAIREAVRVIDEYEGRKADEEAERDLNRYEAEYGADGAAWSRRGGSAW